MRSLSFRDLSLGARAFDPATLFADGKQGVWYDPSDITTLFQDVAGTKSFTANSNPVGLILDKSQGVYLGSKQTYSIDLLTNGSVSSGGTITGAKTITNVNTVAVSFVLPNIVAGKVYEVSVTLQHNNGGVVIVYFSDIAGNTFTPTARSGVQSSAAMSASGKAIIKAHGNNFTLRVSIGNGTLTLDSISVKEVVGNHATQSVSAARPTYKKDTTKSWLYHDKVDDKMTVILPAMTATVVTATDDGVTINYPVSIPSGDYTLTNNSTLGRDYGRLIIDKELSASEQAQVTAYFNAKRGV